MEYTLPTKTELADVLAFQQTAQRNRKCREAHAGLYIAARDLLPLVQALADRERQLEAENTRLRTLLKQAVRPK
jgi:hypothetical protein